MRRQALKLELRAFSPANEGGIGNTRLEAFCEVGPNLPGSAEDGMAIKKGLVASNLTAFLPQG